MSDKGRSTKASPTKLLPASTVDGDEEAAEEEDDEEREGRSPIRPPRAIPSKNWWNRTTMKRIT